MTYRIISYHDGKAVGFLSGPACMPASSARAGLERALDREFSRGYLGGPIPHEEIPVSDVGTVRHGVRAALLTDRDEIHEDRAWAITR